MAIRSIIKLAHLPLHYCVLFDASNSERSKFKDQQEVATRMLNEVVRPGVDRGWLGLFNIEMQQSAETDDPQVLVSAIVAARPFGPTALYDAVVRCAHLMGDSPSDGSLRVIFLFSDGGDNQSRNNSDQATEAAVRASARIYAVAPGGEDVGARLKKLAEKTGGWAYFPGNSKHVSHAIGQVNADLRSLFVVTYAATSISNDVSSIEVRSLRKGVTILSPQRIYRSHP